MRRLAIFAALLLPASALAQNTILRVIDGDTYVVAAPWLPPVLGTTISVRVLGIDTPEHGATAHCPKEAALAAKASAYAATAIAKATVVAVQLAHWDKYGGRVDGTVTVDGQSLGDLLVAAGLAHPYDGGTKTSWCK